MLEAQPASIRLWTVIALALLLGASAARGQGSVPAIVTQSLQVQVAQSGLGSNETVIPLPQPVALTGVSFIYIDTLTLQFTRTSGTGNRGTGMTLTLLGSGGAVTNPVGFGIISSGSSGRYTQRIVLVPTGGGTADSLRVVIANDLQSGGTGAHNSSGGGNRSGGTALVHFVYGDHGSVLDPSPHLRLDLAGGGVISQNVPGTSAWRTIPLATPLPLDGLRLCIPQGLSWGTSGPATADIELILDNGTFVTLDNFASPWSGGTPAGVCSDGFVSVAPGALAGRLLQGVRWRLRVGSGGATYTEPVPWTFRFAFDDTDGDAIWDRWECANGGIPTASGFVLRLNDPPYNCAPNRKDVLVEVDAMTGRMPTAATLGRVAASFAAAPVGVAGGPPGIHLYIQQDEADLPPAAFTNGWASFRAIKETMASPCVANGRFGTCTERSDPNWTDIREAKRRVFRYCIFGEQWRALRVSGAGEVGGNDFAVTLGTWSPVGALGDAQAGAFMHELGHTLGLDHGGGQRDPDPPKDRYNYKPNYYSVMNYTWQMPSSYATAAAGTWRLDYSRETLPTLDENHLVEGDGLGVSYAPSVPYSIPAGQLNCQFQVTCVTPPGNPCLRYTYPHMTWVDWNSDCVPTTVPLSGLDINYLMNARDPSPGQVLTGFNDWANLVFGFRESPYYGAGASPTVETPELDEDTVILLNSLPPPPPTCYANCDGSSAAPVLNVNDFVCFANRFAAGDPYANCDGSTAPPLLNVNDFLCFLNEYAAGCP